MPREPSRRADGLSHVTSFGKDPSPFKNQKQNFRRRAQLSCDRCRINKRKCDRSQPCSRCKQDLVKCTFDRAKKTQDIMRRREEEGKLVNLSGFHHLDSLENIPSNSIQPPFGQSPIPSHHEGSSMRNEIQSSDTSPQTNLTTPDSVADIDVVAHLARIRKDDVSQEDPLKTTQDSIIDQLIETPYFLFRLFSLYIENVDWITDLLRDTRIDRTIARHPCRPKQEISSEFWEVLEYLVYVIIAITSQMCPTEVESILEDLQNERVQRECGNDAQKLGLIAYEIASNKLEDQQFIKQPENWPMEHFAASTLLQTYRKNLGNFTTINKGFLLAHEKAKQAGLCKEPFNRNRFVKHDTIMMEETNLLAYRLFWNFFEKDRIRYWMSDEAYTLRVEDCQVCLRTNDDFHGILINETEIVENFNMERKPVNYCKCFDSDGKLRSDLPKLSKFAYFITRIAFLIRLKRDHLDKMSTEVHFSNTLNDIRSLFTKFDQEDMKLRKEILKCEMEGGFLGGQAAMVYLLFENIRSNFAKRLSNVFAMNALKIDQFSTSQQAILWMLERRRNLTKMDLLEQARKICPSWLKVIRTSYIFVPKFVYEQMKDFINAIQPWFTKYDLIQYDNTLPMQFVKESMYNHLIDCFEAIFRGRNTLVLLTRRNELPVAKKYIQEVCLMLHTLMFKSGLFPLDSEECSNILDSQRLINLTKFTFPKVDRPCFNLEPELNETEQIVPSSQIPTTSKRDELSFFNLVNNESSVLSTLSENNPTSLQEGLVIDLDKLFDDMPELRNFLMLN